VHARPQLRHLQIQMIKLHVNIDHVATLRQARGTTYPDPLWAAPLVELAGADGITVHLREDRRHIQDRDVRLLRQTVRGALNLEMAATDEMVAIAREIGPDVVTLVPEKRAERTTEGGLDVVGGGDALARRVRALVDAKIKVSLFIGPEAEQVRASQAIGAKQIELHTGEYAHAFHGDGRALEHRRLAAAAAEGASLGLEVAAGHGLTRDNVRSLVTIRQIVELNIGHAVIADALFLSVGGAVKAMRDAIEQGLRG